MKENSCPRLFHLMYHHLLTKPYGYRHNHYTILCDNAMREPITQALFSQPSCRTMFQRERVASILEGMAAPVLNRPLQIHKVALKVSILHKSNILSEKTAKLVKAAKSI